MTLATSWVVFEDVAQNRAMRRLGVRGDKRTLRTAPAGAGHAVKEHLAHLDDATVGATTTVPPKLSSPFAPAHRETGAPPAPVSLPMQNVVEGSILSIIASH